MSGGIGQAVSRLDGPEKVSGRARYAADTAVADPVHAVIVPATRARATITAIDLTAASAAPGVIGIFTHRNTPRFGEVTVLLAGESLLPLQDERVLYEGQPVALVVADSLERATEAARLVRVSYRDEPFEADLLAGLDRAELAPEFFGLPGERRVGDVAAAEAAAEVKVEATYLTADRHHNAMEPAAIVADWRAGHLVVDDATQGVMFARDCLAQALKLDPATIRVRSRYIGGGFGGKGWGWPHQILAAMAARELERPVKLVLSRAQMFTGQGYQPASRQTVVLGARRDGTLTSIRHDSIVAGSFAGEYVEGPGHETPAVYACPVFQTSHRFVRLHRGNPTPMRSPIGGVGMVAVEIAMDELATALGMDPLDLRLKNYAETEASHGRPFSSKKLRECYEIGARRFGWGERPAAPRSLRDGRDLIGQGMATALLPAYRFPTQARVGIDRTGQVLVEASTQDVGQGLATVVPQIAAEALGVPVERVTFALGDTALPAAPFTGGSSVTMSMGSAVQDGAEKLRQKLTEAGANGPEGYAGALAALGVDRLTADGEWAPAEADAATAIYSFGAIFVEVRVDEDLLVPRVSRVVGVYSAGRIVNPKTARSQMTGGIIWGIGQALLERSETDTRLGRFLSKNLAGTLIPVNADVPDIDVEFVDEHDPTASPFGGRGIGELGPIGVGAAIANAVFHATGARVREVPIRPEHLMVS